MHFKLCRLRKKIHSAYFSNQRKWRDFPGSPVVKTSSFNIGGAGLIPGQAAKTPHASWPKDQAMKKEAVL